MDASKDVYDFEDSLSNLDAGTSGKSSKKKRSSTPTVKANVTRGMEYSTRSAVQSQMNRRKADNVKNGTTKESSNTRDIAVLDLDEERFSIRDEEYGFG